MQKAAIIAAVFLLSAGIVFAQTSEDTKVEKQMCTASTTTKIIPWTATAGTQFAGSKNFCTNETVRVDLQSNQVVQQATCICRTQAELDATGCGDGQTQPTVTITIPRALSHCVSDSVTISKCEKDPKAAYVAACKSGAFLPPAPNNDLQLDSMATDWTKPIPLLGDANGSEILTQALTERGMPFSDAQQLVENQREDVGSYLKALSSGDSNAVKTTSEKLTVDPSILANMQSLQPPPNPDTNTSANTTAADQQQPDEQSRPTATGFNANNSSLGSSVTVADGVGGPLQCGVGGNEGKIMQAESGCGRTTYNPYSNVQGPYQFLCSTWNSYAQQTGNGQYSCSCTNGGYYAGACDAVNDVNISTNVMRARDAQLSAQYGAQCAAASLQWSTCAYSIHFAGEGGFQQLLSAYQSNPSRALNQTVLASAYSANPFLSKLGTVSDFFAWADSKMNGSSAIMSYAGAAPQSPFTGFTASAASVPVYNTTSPFASVNPLSNMALLQALTSRANQPTAQQAPYNPYLTAPVSTPTSVQQPIHVISTSNPTAPVNAPAQPSATIIAQPHTARVGGAATVSWSSVGTSASVPCTLAQNTTQIARGNSGSKTVVVDGAGALVFTLSCIGPSGAAFSKTDSVTVQ